MAIEGSGVRQGKQSRAAAFHVGGTGTGRTGQVYHFNSSGLDPISTLLYNTLNYFRVRYSLQLQERILILRRRI